MSNLLPRVPNNKDHERVSALFVGPKGENLETLQECFNIIVERQREARLSYYPNDPVFVTPEIKASESYQELKQKILGNVSDLTQILNEKSIPFYSPRYAGHMTFDTSMPAILGYLSTMLYNPNNVAFEASPITTLLEQQVGLQLAEMLGYNINAADTSRPLSWGHIACDGTVANLEAVWAARNLKFYALSLRDAMEPGAELNFIADTFMIQPCIGPKKLLKDLDTWELLNLQPETILEIAGRLYDEYGITSTFLDSVMKKYIIQTVSKDVIEKKWKIEKTPQLFVTQTKHYSWPKAAAIAGIGSENVIDIPVDFDARSTVSDLRKLLQERLDNHQAVYAVIAVIGSTEEGAVDPLEDIINLRTEFKAKGLSFIVHADAAWGGYFASMVPKTIKTIPGKERDSEDYVPHVGLRPSTETQLRALKDTDSITIDPHKSGYVPYPAGGLCYRDGRMRYLLTWTAPYINQGTGESMGVYGVEGSKPGAAAAGTWLSHSVIGLNPDEHGVLLGEVSFTCRRWASHWAAMSDDKTSFTVVPFNRTPTELKPGSTPADILAEKKFIRTNIINKTNAEIAEDPEAMILLQQLGSDLNINAFACNFRYPDGTLNKDIGEANYLNKKVYERLSIQNSDQDPREVPLYLTSTIFAQADYKDCVTEFKRRLGLEGTQDLFVLRNVNMTPFSTEKQFMNELAKIFQDVLEEETENVRERNASKAAIHSFVLQGTVNHKQYFVHRPNYYKETDRYQFIFSAELSPEALQTIKTARDADSNVNFVLENRTPEQLEDIAKGKSFEGTLKKLDGTVVIPSVHVHGLKVIKKRSLDLEDLDSNYPLDYMPFYLYGTKTEQNIDHLLTLAPNIQLSASQVHLKLDKELTDADLEKGLIAFATNVHEASMQPFAKTDALPKGDKFFFHPGKELQITVYRDPFPTDTEDRVVLADVKEKVATGTVTLGSRLFIESLTEPAPKFIPYQTPGARMSSSVKMGWASHVARKLF